MQDVTKCLLTHFTLNGFDIYFYRKQLLIIWKVYHKILIFNSEYGLPYVILMHLQM